MSENDPSDDEPVFEVQHITGDRTMAVLTPQFRLWELDDDQRHVYNALEKFGTSHYTGAIVVPRWAAGKFDTDGETVTLEEAARRHTDAGGEAAETLKRGIRECAETLVPAVASVSVAMQPLVELAEEHELGDSDE